MSEKSEKSATPLKLYLVRFSPCCRAVWFYMLQQKIPFELTDVDVFHGEHREAKFVAMNPHEELPILVDGKTTVCGGLPILRYLSQKYTDYAGWGNKPEDKYKVQSVLDWACTKLLSIVGYKLVYPQLLERYHLGSDADTEVLVERGISQTCELLEALENFHLQDQPFLCGAELTVADSYVATILYQTEWVEFDLKLWPRVSAWLQKVKGQEHWIDVHVQHTEYVQRLKKMSSMECES